MRACLVLLGLILGLLFGSPVHAQEEDDELPPAPPPEGAPAAPSEPEPDAPEPAAAPPDDAAPAPEVAPEERDEASSTAAGARTHDGFHLRIALGFGGVKDALTADLPVFGKLEGSASGGSIAGHLGIAGEVAEGLFLGGALMSETVTSPEIEFEGSPVTDVEVGSLSMLGVMIDWYPDPHGGFHFGGVLAGASISTTDESGDTTAADDRPAGGAGVLMLGYDFWIGDEWSLGGLLRFTGAHLGGDLDHDLGAGSIAFAVTYN
jgi:hypothetical protein